MRENIARQPPLVASAIDHEHAAELARMSEVLRGLRGAAARVTQDLVSGVQHRHLGRVGMSGDQVLRALVLKQLTGFSYAQLAFHLADSTTYRRFCGLGVDGWAPSASTLQSNIKRVRPETLAWIHRRLVNKAVALKIEDGATVRMDSTVVATNIHHPNDSSLLRDSVRVLCRLLGRVQQFVEVRFHDHNRRATRRALGISNAKSMRKRVPLYRDLLKVTGRTLGYARNAVAALARLRTRGARALRAELQQAAALVSRVIDQTHRRVFLGENVPAQDKIVSLFEPHTDILVKGGRDTEYGHKVFVSTGRSGLIVDVTIERGNPADSSQVQPLLRRHRQLFGEVPRQVTLDAGFASRANQQMLVAMGVTDAAFAKNSSFDVMQSVSGTDVHRELVRLRAGIEASISWLKRCFGWSRCGWSGFDSFKAYTLASALAANLLLVARAIRPRFG